MCCELRIAHLLFLCGSTPREALDTVQDCMKAYVSAYILYNFVDCHLWFMVSIVLLYRGSGLNSALGLKAHGFDSRGISQR